jgi:hypothetical protein
VIARKLSCGNKTDAGKRCFEMLAILTQTRFQGGHGVVSYLKTYLLMIAVPEPIPRATR